MACPEFDRMCDSAANGGLSSEQKAKIKKLLQEKAEELSKEIVEKAKAKKPDSFINLLTKK